MYSFNRIIYRDLLLVMSFILALEQSSLDSGQLIRKKSSGRASVNVERSLKKFASILLLVDREKSSSTDVSRPITDSMVVSTEICTVCLLPFVRTGHKARSLESCWFTLCVCNTPSPIRTVNPCSVSVFWAWLRVLVILRLRPI